MADFPRFFAVKIQSASAAMSAIKNNADGKPHPHPNAKAIF